MVDINKQTSKLRTRSITVNFSGFQITVIANFPTHHLSEFLPLYVSYAYPSRPPSFDQRQYKPWSSSLRLSLHLLLLTSSLPQVQVSSPITASRSSTSYVLPVTWEIKFGTHIYKAGDTVLLHTLMFRFFGNNRKQKILNRDGSRHSPNLICSLFIRAYNFIC